MNTNIKVWEVTDTDWVAAMTPYEAIQCLVDTLGYDGVAEADAELGINNPVTALTDEQMNSLMFRDDENDLDSPQRSFRAELDRRIQSGEKFPQHFAVED